MKNSFLIICFIAYNQFASAQKEAAKIHSLNICNVAMSIGASQHFTKSISFNNLLHLAPYSDLLNRTYTGFQENNGGNYLKKSLSFSTCFQFANKKKTAYRNTPLLRFGINYHNSNYFYASQSKKTLSTYEQLQSLQTGMVIGFDSVYNKSMKIEYHYDQILLDGSILLRSNPFKRFSAYTGLGLTAGTSIATTIEIYYRESNHIEVWSADETGFHDLTILNNKYGNEASEEFNLLNNKSYGAYIPVGLDIRLAKKKKYLNLIHFVFESRGGMNMFRIKNLEPLTGFQIDVTMGLKVEW